jgi:hypothetical protein
MRFPAKARYIFKIETMHGTIIVPSTIDHVYFIINKFFNNFKVAILLLSNTNEYVWFDIDIVDVTLNKKFINVAPNGCCFLMTKNHKRLFEILVEKIKVYKYTKANILPLDNIVSKNDIGRCLMYFYFSSSKFEFYDNNSNRWTTDTVRMNTRTILKQLKEVVLRDDGEPYYDLVVNDLHIYINDIIKFLKSFSEYGIIEDECDLIRINALYSSLLFLNVELDKIPYIDNPIYKQLFGLEVEPTIKDTIKFRTKDIYRYDYYTINNTECNPVVYTNNFLLRVMDVKR